jgi:hypothetical protein
LNSRPNRLRNLPGPNEQIIASADRYQSLVDFILKRVCYVAVVNHGG